jgi:hypothetical protein
MIEYSEWNCTEFIITLKQPMSEMLGKMTFFLVDLEFKNVRGSTRTKDKNDFQSIF